MDQAVEYDMNFNFSEAVVCQKRKLPAKQFLIICETTDQTLFKGPFNEPKSGKAAGNQKLTDLISRANTMVQWDTPLVVLPCRNDDDGNVSIVNFDFQNPKVTGKFVEFPNLIAGVEQETELVTEKNDPEIKYRAIVERKGVVRLSDYIVDMPNETWFYERECMLELTLAHIHLFALGSGDRNLGNVLVDIKKKTLHIVDFEESRSADTEDELFYFTQLPAKKYADIWVKHARKIYGDLLSFQDFDVLDPTPDQKNRLDKARKILESFQNSAGEYVARPRQSKLKDAATTKEDATSKVKKESEKSKVPRKVKPLEIIDNGNLGKMKWAGGFSKDTISYTGYTLDQLRSAVQGYIQHGDTEKALMAAVEMYRLNEAGGAQTPITSLINRLRQSAAEDIGLADIPLVIHIFSIFNKRGHMTFQAIAEVIKAMCAAKKSQLVPQIWRTYATPEGRAYAKNKDINIEWDLVEEDMEIYQERIDESPFWLDGDPEELKPYGENLYDRLINGDFVVFCWLAMFLEKSIGADKKPLKVTRRAKRTQASEIIWQMLGRWDAPQKLNDSNDTTLINILSDTYYDVSNGIPMMVLAFLCYLHKIKNVPHGKLEHVNVDKLMDGDYKLTIDEEYIVEKKVARGRGNTNKGLRPAGGSVLANQCDKWFNEKYHDVYMNA